MSKANLHATINAVIKQNGNEKITGTILNSVLNQIVDALLDYLNVQEHGLYIVDKNKNIAL